MIPGQSGPQTCWSEGYLSLGCETREGPFGVGDRGLAGRRRRTGLRGKHINCLINSSGVVDGDRWLAGRGINIRRKVATHHQLKVGVRDLSGRGVSAGNRCLQLTLGVRDRALYNQHSSVFLRSSIPLFETSRSHQSNECNPQQKTVLYSSRKRRAESRRVELVLSVEKGLSH